MLVIRPVTLKDLAGVEKCSVTAGPGLSHLPKSHNAIESKVYTAIQSFAKEVTKPESEEYLFVLADHKTGEIGGTCGIYSRTGTPVPFYAYRIEHAPPLPNGLPGPTENRILHVKCYQGGPSEICALYLLPEFRKEGLGKLLSLNRFLFMANHPHRFTHDIIANMRGVIDQHTSVFWECVGRHFLNLPFEEVMALRAASEQFVPYILPQYPVFVTLLPAEVGPVIGATHPNTKPALNMLLHEGFQYIEEIDPFDGGPIISAEMHNIRSVKNSIVGHIEKISSAPLASGKYIVSNTRIDFRACYSPLISTPDHLLTIPEDVAEALQVQMGDALRYISPVS